MSTAERLVNETSSSPWKNYYDWTTQFSQPWSILAQTVELFKDEKIAPSCAIDLGCGSGRDTNFLLGNGWKVIAVDADKLAEKYLLERIDPSLHKNVTFVGSTFENFLFPHNATLINASLALPFCDPAHFDNVMKRMTDAIAPGGRFCGHFFGPNDDWASTKTLVFLDKKTVLNYFAGFTIEYYREEDQDGISGTGTKHWHRHHLIAQKNLTPLTSKI